MVGTIARAEITTTGLVRFLPPKTPFLSQAAFHDLTQDTLSIRYTNQKFTDK